MLTIATMITETMIMILMTRFIKRMTTKVMSKMMVTMMLMTLSG